MLNFTPNIQQSKALCREFMIEVGDFYKLRLKDFLPNRNLDRAWFTSYLGSYWFGQTYYFTDILQPVNNPFKTHSLSVEFERLENDEITSLFQILGISVDSNFTYERMVQNFGSPE